MLAPGLAQEILFDPATGKTIHGHANHGAIIFTLLSLLHGAVLRAQSLRKLESVTLGLSAKHVLNLPIYLAQRQAIFESEGFDYKPITTKTNTAIAALVSGDLDYITAFNSGLGAAIGGAPLVAAYVSTDKPLLYLISRPDIKDAKTLRGGIIGHGGTRGSHYHATVAMVKTLGLDADKDVKLLSTIDVTQGMVALLSGTVAAATLSPPYDSIAVRKGYNRLVLGPEVCRASWKTAWSCAELNCATIRIKYGVPARDASRLVLRHGPSQRSRCADPEGMESRPRNCANRL